MPEPVLAVALGGPKEPTRVGMSLTIEIEVKNVSQESVWIVGVVDGSEEGIRYPQYVPQIVRGGEVIGKPPPPEDPLVAPLRLVDFQLLAAGAAFDPTKPRQGAAWLPISTFTAFRPGSPGRYELSLILSTESQHLEQWLGRFGQEADRAAILERIAQVPRLTVRSNVLQVEVA
jgi:hypothetical protein